MSLEGRWFQDCVQRLGSTSSSENASGAATNE